MDLAFDPSGDLYALEFDSNGLLNPGDSGALIRLASDGSQSPLITEGLTAPTGVVFSEAGIPFVTNNSRSPGEGEVVRSVPEPGTLGLFSLGALALTLGCMARERVRTARVA